MDAQSAFAEILENLPRQHLRTRFRNRFGTPDSDFGENSFARGSVRVALDRRLGHLLQEEPEDLSAVLISGPASELGITRTTPSPADEIGSLVAEDRFLLVHGKTAHLYAYLAPGDSEVWIRRVAVPKESRPGVKPAGPVLSRRERAAAAGKMKFVKKSPQRRRR